ncbi:hypothetical protein BAU08_23820 [Bordetella bronchialis]|uniref:Uncharacterized protein n=1 Tax=Bordetella bronchialis TaxID=463025 RepID=A0A193FNT2_9BORD|nr:hypothetical protein BAU06_23265 [Bordetella bronchialis]ANN73975.1 hypothetical protein BAU08_23820 [Bordetella bronchialis]
MLASLVPTGQHHYYGIAALNVIHAPPGAEVFSHFRDAIPYRLHLSQVSQSSLIKALDQALPGYGILETFEPVGESGEKFYDVGHTEL